MIKGIPVSQGIGIGRVVLADAGEPVWNPEKAVDPNAEKDRLHHALQRFNEKTEHLAKSIEQAEDASRTSDSSQAEILRGHIAMLADPFLISQMEEQIAGGKCAEDACYAALSMFESIFMQTEDELMRQRAADVRDIRRRMLQILTGTEPAPLGDIPEGSVLVAEEVTPSMLAEVNRKNLSAIAAEKGGNTAHSAILARSMELPAVYSAEGLLRSVKQGDLLVVDGMDGKVIPNPGQTELEHYQTRQKEELERKAQLEIFRNRQTKMADGQKKEVFCNIGTPEEAVAALEKGGEGIGLFRTEFLFTEKSTMPDEETQFQAYKTAAECFAGKPVIVRTLDVGGDKQIPYLHMEKEENPFLGFRAVRFCLKNEQLYETQLRAMIRASAFGNLMIMIPLVTCVEEVRSVKSLVKKIMCQLDGQGIPYNKELKVGIMVETPAACQIADLLAEESDFFSIGTNDLVQYTMAADRGNPKVGYLNRPMHPAVLRSVRHIIACGKKAGIPVGMCGEAAADPLLTPLLLAFGLDEFSVSPSAVLQTRAQIGKWTGEKAEKIAEDVFQMKTAEEVEKYLKSI